MHRFLAVLLAASVLAGCSGGADEALPENCTAWATCDAAGAMANRTASLPTWRIGDWWNFTSTTGGAAFSHIVTGESAQEWFMDTDSPASAFRNALSDVSYLGPIRKSDLAGSQGTDRIAYMSWPLEDNKTWTTTWDGLPMKLKAHLVTAEKGKALDVPRFFIEARYSNGTLYATYTYDPQVRWFRTVDFYEGGTEPAFGFALSNSGRNYPGNYVRWRIQSIVDKAGPLASANVETGEFSVALNATDVWVSFAVKCTVGPAGVGVAPAPFFSPVETRGAGTDAPACPQDETSSVSAGAPVAPPTGGPETWGWEINGSPGTDGTYKLTVLVRWLDVFSLPPAPASAAA